MRPGRNYLVPIIHLVDFVGGLVFFRKRKTADVKSILVLQPANFGDVVVTLPTMKGFKEAFPEAKVDVFVKKNMQELLNYLNEKSILAGKKFYIDKAYYLEEDWLPTNGKLAIKSLWRFTKTKLYKTLKSNKYDLIVDVHGDPRNIWLAWTLGGKLRAGFGIRGLGFLLTHKAVFDHNEHIIDRYFKIVTIFKDVILPEEVGFPKKEDKKWKRICLHPGTGLDIKQWKEDSWAVLADDFISKGYKVIFTGTPEEKELLDRIKRSMELGNLANISIIKTTSTLLNELEMCDLFISTDTGPAHIAHFKGTPQLQIFGPSMAKRWGYENVCSVECECMNELECKYGFENRCLIKLKPDIVIKKAEEILNGT